jgi:hypothetical protein
MLTPTLKIKRDVILKLFAREVGELYAEQARSNSAL